MTMYSIYNYGTRQYDYYRGPGDGATHAGSPKIRARSDIGAIPEQAAWALPPGAVRAGSGDLPQGRIASLGAFDAGDGVKLGLMAVAAYLAWKVLR